MQLRDYIRALTKRWLLVVLTVVLGVLAGIGVTLAIPPTYQAGTLLFVSTQTDASNPNQQLFQGGSFTVGRVKSYAELATSPKVLDPVISQLGLTESADAVAQQITVGVPAGTVLLELTVSDRSPDAAAGLANAVDAQLIKVIEEIETPASGQASPVKVTTLKQATPPTAPAWPRLSVTVAAGLLAGLILGIGLALLRETLDVTVKNADDLARATDAPILATVARDAEARDQPIMLGDSRTFRAEAYRQLRTNLQFALLDDEPSVIAVTSAVAGEGKSSIVGNLAVTLQRLGVRVCLVDGDLRRPSLAGYFGLVEEAGLTTVLIGRARIDTVLQQAGSGLDVVTSGPVPPNPTDLLSSRQMSELLDELLQRYDIVLLDTPPVLPVADAAVLTNLAKGVLFVVQAEKTPRNQVEHALRTIAQANARVLGVVLNMVSAKGRASSYYTYERPPPDHAEPPTSPARSARRATNGVADIASTSPAVAQAAPRNGSTGRPEHLLPAHRLRAADTAARPADPPRGS